MAIEFLKPLSLYASANAKTGADVIADMSDDPTSVLSENSSAYPIYKSTSWSLDFIMNSPSTNRLKGNVLVRLRAMTSDFNGMVLPKVVVYVNNTVVYDSMYDLSFATVPSYYDVSFPASLLGDLAGKELRLKFDGGFDENGLGQHNTLYAIDMVVDLEDITTYVNPYVPTSLTPVNNYETSSTSISFTAVVDDEEVDDYLALIVEFSTDNTFTSNTMIVTGNRVSNGATSIATSNEFSNGTWYWRCRVNDSGGLYSSYSPVRVLVVDNKAPSMPTNLTPSNNIVITQSSFNISATSVDPEGEPVSIAFEVSESIDFSTLKQAGSFSSGSSVTISSLNQGNYYWRVRASDAFGNNSGWTNVRGVFVNTPSAGRLSPDNILELTGATGALSAIIDDPDSSDASWIIGSGSSDSIIRVSFPSISGGVKVGVGSQNFRVLVKKSTSSTSDGTVTIGLYENGVSKATQSFTMTTPEIVYQLNWDASLLSDQSGSNVECRVVGAGIYSGKASSQFAINVGAIEWNYQSNSEPQVPIEEITYPVPSIISISSLRLSDEIGKNVISVRMTFDIDVAEWRMNVIGTSWDTGIVAHSHVGNVIAGTVCVAEIDWSELYQEGENRVNFYGKSLSGEWTPYNDATNGNSPQYGIEQ